MLRDKILDLKEKVVRYTAMVREMIDDSCMALFDKNRALAMKVIEVSEPTVNSRELQLNEECINVIALFHPEAKDLRLVMMVPRMLSDLERMGDKAVNIAESVLELIDKPIVKSLIEMPRMKEVTLQMLDDSVTAFINEDSGLAYATVARDAVVNSLRDQVLKELITCMSSDPATISRSLHLIQIARNLEKIADLTTNICEEVVYVREGKLIRAQHDGRPGDTGTDDNADNPV